MDSNKGDLRVYMLGVPVTIVSHGLCGKEHCPVETHTDIPELDQCSTPGATNAEALLGCYVLIAYFTSDSPAVHHR